MALLEILDDESSDDEHCSLAALALRVRTTTTTTAVTAHRDLINLDDDSADCNFVDLITPPRVDLKRQLQQDKTPSSKRCRD
ncbi:unnamed protein product, partial [Polarella glacialis]